ncbi:hypothetical protein BV22DRAFT_15574 [Leucogyrophana mollusca]|uniref:Uncharacterized protein n=1 Tax=Leucogyrophana mollusca TaxID=85980 RepID=A0ACB8C1N4_9AGAM|nr:hypothetical protein BV22DRAFT_15574 [Leucogyrophana mollusca]
MWHFLVSFPRSSHACDYIPGTATLLKDDFTVVTREPSSSLAFRTSMAPGNQASHASLSMLSSRSITTAAMTIRSLPIAPSSSSSLPSSSSTTPTVNRPSFITPLHDTPSSSSTLLRAPSISSDPESSSRAITSIVFTTSGVSSATVSVNSDVMSNSQSSTSVSPSSVGEVTSPPASATSSVAAELPPDDHDDDTKSSQNETSNSGALETLSWLPSSAGPPTSGAPATSTLSGAPTTRLPPGPSAAPQQLVSATDTLVTITTQTTVSGRTYETTLTVESIAPARVSSSPMHASSTSSPNNSGGSHSILPEILGPVLGVLALLALGVTLSRNLHQSLGGALHGLIGVQATRDPCLR